MPHCDLFLYEDVLKENASKEVVLVGNLFSAYELRADSDSIVLRAVGHVEEELLLPFSVSPRAFNDTAVIHFPCSLPELRERLAAEQAAKAEKESETASGMRKKDVAHKALSGKK